MKKLLLSLPKYASAFILTGMLLLNATDSHAKKSAKLVTDSSGIINPSLSYIGSNNESTLLLLSFETEKPVAFNLVVSDEFGEILYNKAFETAVMKKYLKLLLEPGAVDRKIFVSLKTKASETHRFEVKTRFNEIPVMEIARY